MQLEVNNVSYYYGAAIALDNISLSVDKEEIVAIVGSNGAGKTTLLKVISGIFKPSAGKILFEGKRIDGLKAFNIVKLGIALVPEGRQIFPQMTVLENLLMGTYMIKDKRRRKERLKMVYEIFPILEERKNQIANTLSGGEQQMLAIGRALMSSPKLLMLDEPSTGLAPVIVEKIFKLIRKINEEFGISILLVEQNVKKSLSIANRGYVLETGKITMKGSSKELLENEYIKRAYLGL